MAGYRALAVWQRAMDLTMGLTYITEAESNRLLPEAARIARMLGGLKSSLKRELEESDKKL